MYAAEFTCVTLYLLFKAKHINWLHHRPPNTVKANAGKITHNFYFESRQREKNTNSKQTQTTAQLSQISGFPLRDDGSCFGNIYSDKNTSAKEQTNVRQQLPPCVCLSSSAVGRRPSARSPRFSRHQHK